MENLFVVFVPPVVPPAIPGQPPYYYVIYGILLSLMGIILSSTALFAFNLTERVSRIVYFIGCFLSICFGVYCGNMLHPLVAGAVGIVLTIISIFVYIKSCEGKGNRMKRFVTVYTSSEGYEYWLKLEVDLIHSCRETLQVKNGNISFFVSSYNIDTLYSTCNWKDVFCVNKAGDRLTIEVADKKLDVKVEFSKKAILPY